MKSFMDKDFLLSNETAKTLFHDYAEKMPIIDYHCHINPEEIAENRHFSTITQVWLGGDHYKWRQMRSNGIPECFITGDAPDDEKFEKWAETMEQAIGNPLYHWSHLELLRYFKIAEPLTKENAKEIYTRCNEQLAKDSMSVRGLIKSSNVEVVCTTDDPCDSLLWHDKIAKDSSFDVKVLPAFRPDKVMNIEKPDYIEYISKLSEAADCKIHSYNDLKKAVINRLSYFNAMGCSVSDHGLAYMMYEPASEQEVETIFSKRLLGESLSEKEQLQFKTAFLLFIGKEYHRLNWVMQLHFGAKRDNNSLLYHKLGPDTGFDCISTRTSTDQLADLLNALNETNELPKTIIYSLNPTDNAAIGSIIGCFQDDSIAGKIQHGSAWWFNDNKKGMEDQLISLANLGLLGNFVGMLTDSRSFLSYTRHEYFRRILCNLIGTWVENGEYPNDIKRLGKMVEDISYNNAKKYFGF